MPAGFFGAVHPRFRTPWKATVLTGIFVGSWARSCRWILAELVNIGTLLAFVIVCAAVLIMRRTNPEGATLPLPVCAARADPRHRFCLLLMFSLPAENWLRLIVWLLLGFAVYFGYGRHHSVLARMQTNIELGRFRFVLTAKEYP